MVWSRILKELPYHICTIKIRQHPQHCNFFFREVQEETGYSIAEKVDPDQYSEQVLNDQVSLTRSLMIGQDRIIRQTSDLFSFFQLCRLYFVPGLPTDTKFCPKTKQEIRDIQWFNLDLLPSSKKDPIPDGIALTHNSLYMVMPFVR